MAIVLNSPVRGKNDVPSVEQSPVGVKSYTTAQVNALTGQDPGTIVWDSDALAHKIYNGTTWVRISSFSDLRGYVRAAGIWTTGPVSGLASFGGVTPLDGERMLVISNISPDPVAVGIYVAHAGAWTRPSDFAAGSHAEGALVQATQGTAAGAVYKCETVGPTDVVDTDALVFSTLVIALTQAGGFTQAVDPVSFSGTRFASDTVEVRHFGVSTWRWRVDAAVTGGGAGFNFFCPTAGSVGNNSAQLGIPDGTLMWGDSTIRIYATLQKDVTPVATPNFDPFDGQYQTLTLDATLSGWTLTNGGGTTHGATALQGQTITINFLQDGTGGWGTGTPPSNVRFIGGAMVPPDTTPGSANLYTFRWDKPLATWFEQNPPAIGV